MEMIATEAILYGKVSPEEWHNAKRLLVEVLHDPSSGDDEVKDAFSRLLAMTDRERAYATFPQLMESLRQAHPQMVATISFSLPERFHEKAPIPLIA